MNRAVLAESQPGAALHTAGDGVSPAIDADGFGESLAAVGGANVEGIAALPAPVAEMQGALSVDDGLGDLAVVRSADGPDIGAADPSCD